ncbi:MAG: LamG-like jellyroll fold domain-containing protein [Chitinophagales bacterium]|nr:LamG-like jellyroll fold domain-containing protein [Chitinophagales bacterium]
MKTHVNLLKMAASILICSAFMLPFQTHSQCIIADFPFNGNANDVSGNGNNGTVSGATPTIGHDGVANSAYFFDTVNDVIQVNNTLGNFGTADYSFSCWFKTTVMDVRTLITKRPTCNFTTSFRIALRDGIVTFEVLINTTQVVGDGTILVGDGNWHHVVLVRDDKRYTIYVDGVLDIVVYSASLLNLRNNSVLQFGDDVCVGFGNDEKFTGSLDDIKFFDCALNAIEIAQLINDTAGCTVYTYDTVTVPVFDTTTVNVFDTISVAVTDTLIIDVILSTNPFNTSEIKVYPNPTNNLIVVENNMYSQMTNYTLKIMNGLGQQLFSSPFNLPSITIDISQIGAAGIYTLQILSPSGQVTEEKKIVLQ